MIVLNLKPLLKQSYITQLKNHNEKNNKEKKNTCIYTRGYMIIFLSKSLRSKKLKVNRKKSLNEVIKKR